MPDFGSAASGEQLGSVGKWKDPDDRLCWLLGSHPCVELLNVVVLDNFCKRSPAVLDRVKEICGKSLDVVNGDTREQATMESILRRYNRTTVLHFAGLKSVQDSVARPLEYCDYNAVGSRRILAKIARDFSAEVTGQKPPDVAKIAVLRNIFTFRTSTVFDSPKMVELHSEDLALE